MRNFGLALLVAGVLGFLYASRELETAPPMPPGLSVGETVDYPAGRWELVRYGAAFCGGLGLIVLLFPKGR
jgi:hypothetical protein